MPNNFGSVNVGGGWGPPALNQELLRYFDEKARSGVSNLGSMAGAALGGGMRGMKNAEAAKSGAPVADGEPMGFFSGAKEGVFDATGGEEYKREQDAGKAADYFIKAMGPDALAEMGVHPEQYKTFGARDKAALVSGWFRAQTLKDMQRPQQTDAALGGMARSLMARLAAKPGPAPEGTTVNADGSYQAPSPFGNSFGQRQAPQVSDRLTAADIMSALAEHPQAGREATPLLSSILHWQDQGQDDSSGFKREHLDYLKRNLTLQERQTTDRENAAANANKGGEIDAQVIKGPDGKVLGVKVGSDVHWSDTNKQLSPTTQNLLYAKSVNLQARQAELNALEERIAKEPGNKKAGPDFWPFSTSYADQAEALRGQIAQIAQEMEQIKSGNYPGASRPLPTSGATNAAPAAAGTNSILGDFERWKKQRK